MEVVDEAIDEFQAVMEFFDDWISTKSGRDKVVDIQNGEIFKCILKRYVDITRKLAIDLFDLFDLYVVGKNRNPLIKKRLDGKKDKKVHFGSRKYRIEVQSTRDDELPILSSIVDSLTKEELTIINTLYSGALKLCRLILFMRDIKDDKPAEKGEQIVTEIINNPGIIVRGLLTYSPYGSTEKEIKVYLDVTDSCKNLSGVEVYHTDEVTFGLKLILAKLKRIRHPYVTAIQSVEKLDETYVQTPQNWVPKNLQDLSAGDAANPSVSKSCTAVHQENLGEGDFADSFLEDSKDQRDEEGLNWKTASVERLQEWDIEGEHIELQTRTKQKFEERRETSSLGIEGPDKIEKTTAPVLLSKKYTEQSEEPSAKELTSSDVGYRLPNQCALQ